MPTRPLTYNELKADAERLRKKVEEGDATMAEAEQLSNLERDIRRYEAVRKGLSW